MRKTVLFNDNWSFIKVKRNTDMGAVMSAGNWNAVDIPHDWLIYDSNNLYEDSEGWYKKDFDFEPVNDEKYALRFEGVYMEPEIFVNGVKAGEWKYGYNTFELDITNLLRKGKNQVVVHVTHPFPNSRWYSGAGIYRNIYFKTMPEEHIVSDGIYIRTVKNGSAYDIRVSTEYKGDIGQIAYTVFDENGVKTASYCGKIQDTTIISVDNPTEWSLDRPVCYTLRTELIKDNATVDSIDCNFGFRTIEFDCNRGFFLNGEHVKIRGMCMHHDLGSLGAAINREAVKRQLVSLKKMGANAIRTSHNMPATEVLELCDEIGLLVQAETFDMWNMPKNEFDYARFFKDWAVKDVTNFVRRDRNHPSLIMWSIGNEIYDTHADAVSGYETTKMLYDAVCTSDYENNAYASFGSNFLEGENTQKCAQILGIVGYNYSERLYDDHHKKHPKWVIYGSETGSTLQSRSVYHFPYSEPILTDIDEQCSSLGNSTCSWGAKNTEFCITTERDNEYSAGQFIWTGWDYIGEPTPYQTKNSYFGQVDTAGFEKDTYYIYQAEWTDYKKKPMIHIFPYWDFNEGQIIDVRVTSNAPDIELFKDDVSLGKFHIDHEHGKELLGHWQIPYEKGVLRAVAYDEDGRIVAEDVKRSFGDAKKVKINPDRVQPLANGEDMIFAEINVVDENGAVVENANNRINIKVTGEGRLLGVDNGDSTDYDSYKGTSRKLFMGKMIALIATTTKAGDIIIEAESKGIEADRIVIKSVEAEAREGISCKTHNTDSVIKDEIAIRKIEIRSSNGNRLTGECKEVMLEAVLYPDNCTYNEIEWCVINSSGVISNLAEIQPDGLKAVLKAKGDGNFIVRCYTKNGGEKVNVISQLDFSVEGVGDAFINPYKPVSAALFDSKKGEIGNAGEHAIATQKDAETFLTFNNVDFGNLGTDEVTMWVFTFDHKDYPVQIWSGIPGEEDSRLLMDGVYNQPVTWDVFKPQTFKLNCSIKGVNTITVVTKDFINLRDFVFAKPDKGFMKLNAAAHDSIYGDDFNISGDSVCGIGNNVSIDFKDMDFKDGVTSLEICGTSYIEVNTINIIFVDEQNNQTRQMLAFEKTDGEFVREFNINKVSGKNKVTFVFLPGTQFDFHWFRFK